MGSPGEFCRKPSFDIVRAQDLPQIAGKDDVALLEFATGEGRVMVTHDVSTTVPAMREPLDQTGRCAPVVLVLDALPINAAIDDLLMALCAPSVLSLTR